MAAVVSTTNGETVPTKAYDVLHAHKGTCLDTAQRRIGVPIFSQECTRYFADLVHNAGLSAYELHQEITEDRPVSL